MREDIQDRVYKAVSKYPGQAIICKLVHDPAICACPFTSLSPMVCTCWPRVEVHSAGPVAR